MVDAIKPKSKRSLGGLGHDMADEFTNQWWHRAYNNATSNIKVKYSYLQILSLFYYIFATFITSIFLFHLLKPHLIPRYSQPNLLINAILLQIDSLENGEVKSFGTANDPKKDKTNMNKMPLYFQTFVQSAVLENGQTTHQEDNQIDNEVPQEIADSISEKSESESKLKHLTDDELFAACGKRTAHKYGIYHLFNEKFIIIKISLIILQFT